MRAGPLDDQISSMVSSARGLVRILEQSPIDALPDAAARLTTRVIRPLAGPSADQVAVPAAGSWPTGEQALWALARTPTTAAAAPDAPVAVAEAAAALQEMVSLTGDAGRLAELASLQAARPAGVQ